jgi:hypothetical protein
MDVVPSKRAAQQPAIDGDDGEETDALILSKLESQPPQVDTVNKPSASSTSLFQGNLHIYTSRDFSNIGLSRKQKIVVLLVIVLVGFLIKSIAVDPFRTDKARWEQKKSFVDGVVEKEIADSNTNREDLIELEKSAEDFVRNEEGDNV